MRRAIGIRQLWTQIRRLWRPAMTGVFVLAASSRCIEWKQPTEAVGNGISHYIAAVQTLAGDANAVLKSGAAPAAGTGPIVTAPVPALVLLGGTIELLATSPTPFTKVVVTVPGVSDYWELTLPSPTLSTQLLVVFAQDIPKNVFDMRFGGALSGAYGAQQTNTLSVINVGTGDVQINITWDSKADVDLHVVDPSGQEIYWANRSSTTGGQLDLDSNAACGSDGPRAENIFWGSGLIAPHGDFYIRADYWSACTALQTNYVVTVHAKGRPPQVFSGVFVGAGDAGNAGAGRQITTLHY